MANCKASFANPAMPNCYFTFIWLRSCLIVLVLVVKLNLRIQTINPLSLLGDGIELEIVISLFLLARP